MVYNIFQIQENVPVGRIRSIVSQVLASSASTLLLLDLGMAISFATIVLPNVLHAKDGISFDEAQASWFGSLPFLTQPLGALISGPIVDYFGRKKATFLVNIPHVVAWTLAYLSWNVASLFVANGLLGLGTGIMEAPVNAYVGEISEPSLRGSLCTATLLFVSIGMFLMYFLGVVVDWRVAAIISLCIPIASMLFVVFGAVPDTPVWLLSQGREKDAIKSLCFLRGWTTEDNVREEFDELVVYSKKLNSCVICLKQNKVAEECDHRKMNIIRSFFIKFKIIMLCKATLRPLALEVLYFTFVVMSGLIPIRPNMVNVCEAFGMADDGKNIAVMVGVISFITSIVPIVIIKYLGKRKIGITAMLGTGMCCTALSIYAKLHLAPTVFSYEPKTFPTEKSVLPLVFFYGLTAFTELNVTWIILGEIFPFRSRASSQGIAAAWNYFVSFLGSKTLIDLEASFNLSGAFAVYAGFAYIGTIYLYFFLPETEGKSLQEIETYYEGDFRIFADDWFIRILKKLKKKIRK